MNTTSLHIQIEPTVKQQAQKTADELGLSLSSVVKALLKQFVRTKQLSVSIKERPEIPNAYLRQSLKQSEEDIKAGRTQKFETWDAVFDHLSHEIEDDKRAAHEFGPLFNKQRQAAPRPCPRRYFPHNLLPRKAQ